MKTLRSYLGITFGIVIMLAACGKQEPDVDRGKVVNKIRSASKLATVEYVVTKVISAQKKHLLSKDTYFFAETEATIKAGIDLNKIRPEDIQIEGTQVQVELPAIELINFSYPAKGFHVIDDYTYNNFWLKWKNFSVMEKDKLYRMGEQDIRDNISNLGITQSAKENTRRLLSRILSKAGFDEIYISFKQQQNTNVIKQLKEDIKAIQNQ